jgi:hypothetical protein
MCMKTKHLSSNCGNVVENKAVRGHDKDTRMVSIGSPENQPTLVIPAQAGIHPTWVPTFALRPKAFGRPVAGTTRVFFSSGGPQAHQNSVQTELTGASRPPWGGHPFAPLRAGSARAAGAGRSHDSGRDARGTSGDLRFRFCVAHRSAERQAIQNRGQKSDKTALTGVLKANLRARRNPLSVGNVLALAANFGRNTLEFHLRLRDSHG